MEWVRFTHVVWRRCPASRSSRSPTSGSQPRESLCDEVGGKPTTDGLAVASLATIDGLVIASPEDSHESLVHAALAKGTRILCEKPLAVGVDACRRIVDAEVALGHRLLQLGLMRVYDPAHVQLAAEPCGPRCDPSRSLRAPQRPRGSPHRATGAEPIRRARHPLASVAGRSRDRPSHDHRHARTPTTSSTCLVTAEFHGGGYGTIEFSEHSFAYEVTVEVDAELGGLVMAPVMRPTIRRDGGAGVDIGTDWFGRFADAYRVEDDTWLRSIAAGAAIGPSAWDGLVAERVVQAAIESLSDPSAGGDRHIDTPDLYA